MTKQPVVSACVLWFNVRQKQTIQMLKVKKRREIQNNCLTMEQ